MTMVNAGDILELRIERPALGGRMIARVDGAVVLVAGAIPGETARVRVERRARGVAFGAVVDVLEPSPDRRAVADDAGCGGRAYAHIAYARQLSLKRDCVLDALRHVGRGLEAQVAEPWASPEQGYRLRARLHWQHGRLGFLREGTYEVCDPAAGGQLLPATVETLERVARVLPRSGAEFVDVVENMTASERVVRVRLTRGEADRTAARVAAIDGLTGAVVEGDRASDTPATIGQPFVTDEFAHDDRSWRLAHRPQSFFQANRYLIAPMVRHVVAAVDEGLVVDLFAGVGLFGIGVAAVRGGEVIAVEADPASAGDLRANARQLGTAVRVVPLTVERHLAREPLPADACVILDPPRTGLPEEVRRGVAESRVRRLVYVSCDAATFARDARALVDAGFTIGAVQPIDIFPGTPHIEMVATFDRG